MKEELLVTTDLRVFLTNMARAKHDGNAIGIAVDASDVSWLNDKVASTKQAEMQFHL